MPAIDELLTLLTDAVHLGDAKRFLELCHAHADAIAEQFPQWVAMPEAMRGYRHASVLKHVARFFEDAGYPQATVLLARHDAGLLFEWQRELKQAKGLADAGGTQAGLDAATASLAAIEKSGMSSPAYLSCRSQAYGLRSLLLVQLGRDDEAREAMEAALADCKEARDHEGVSVYRRNLETLDTRRPTVPGNIELEIELLEQVQLAQRRTDLHRYQASNSILERLLALTGDAVPIVQRMRSLLFGRIGFNDFMLGNVDVARGRITAAYDACMVDDDQAGAAIYRENLAVVGRRQALPSCRSELEPF